MNKVGLYAVILHLFTVDSFMRQSKWKIITVNGETISVDDLKPIDKDSLVKLVE